MPALADEAFMRANHMPQATWDEEQSICEYGGAAQAKYAEAFMFNTAWPEPVATGPAVAVRIKQVQEC
jgi:hypothetical protein